MTTDTSSQIINGRHRLARAGGEGKGESGKPDSPTPALNREAGTPYCVPEAFAAIPDHPERKK